MPVPAPAWCVMHPGDGISRGIPMGGEMTVSAQYATFARSCVIFASFATSAIDPSASVPGTLSVKWTFEDGQVVNEESKAVNRTGAGNSEFHIAKPDGFPAGNYKVEISLDGNVVQSKDFSVK